MSINQLPLAGRVVTPFQGANLQPGLCGHGRPMVSRGNGGIAAGAILYISRCQNGLGQGGQPHASYHRPRRRGRTCPAGWHEAYV